MFMNLRTVLSMSKEWELSSFVALAALLNQSS